jgi:hypothetical protein
MDDADQAFTQALRELQDRWEVAVSVFPELNEIRARLALTSHQLAFAFVTQLLESRKFNIAAGIASHMEQAFLERFFGADKQVVMFARELIALGRKDAAKALNRLVDVLGSEVDADRIISKVVSQYDVNRSREEAAVADEEEYKRRALRVRISVLRERLPSLPYVDLANELATLLGYQVSESGGSLFKDTEYTVRRNQLVVGKFSSGPDFVTWVKQSLL